MRVMWSANAASCSADRATTAVARDANDWRPYNGGGMHDPASITGGRYDHLHVTFKAGA